MNDPQHFRRLFVQHCNIDNRSKPSLSYLHAPPKRGRGTYNGGDSGGGQPPQPQRRSPSAHQGTSLGGPRSPAAHHDTQVVGRRRAAGTPRSRELVGCRRPPAHHPLHKLAWRGSFL